jgi:3-hydroxyisobutyrate dehydrogenase
MVNQICIAGLVQGISGDVNFWIKAGLDMKKLIDTISKSAAGSWQMENRAATMVKGEFIFGFAVDWIRKNLSICSEEKTRKVLACRSRHLSINSIQRCRYAIICLGTHTSSHK